MTEHPDDEVGRLAARLAHHLRTRVGAAARPEPERPVSPAPSDLARRIDHTLLKADATPEDVDRLCDEARRHGFASVCVNTVHVARAAGRVAGSDVGVCAVVGFPLGAMSPEAKAFEARCAVRDGAREIDMVLQIGALKAGDHRTVFEDIRGVVVAAVPARVKVILETALLDDERKVIACVLAELAGAHFVKTSTGFAVGGATVEDVGLMRRVVGNRMQVKASGGIRTREDALRMIAAGADRIGASASVTIVVPGDAPTTSGPY